MLGASNLMPVTEPVRLSELVSLLPLRMPAVLLVWGQLVQSLALSGQLPPLEQRLAEPLVPQSPLGLVLPEPQ